MKWLDDLKDIYLVEKRLRNVYAGKSKAFSLSEVRSELNWKDRAGKNVTFS